MSFRFTFILFLALIPTIMMAQQEPAIIPKPAELTMGGGFFQIDNSTSVHYNPGKKALKPAVTFLVNAIRNISGINLKINKAEKKNINIIMAGPAAFANEGYSLSITNANITIKAGSYGGVFYAIQSLLQTLPRVRTNQLLQVSCMEIKDHPRFGWRGMHLDVSRHFFSPDVIKEYIDLMATYKMNMFHWHLVDDQGWRIEIKKYPKLTQIGAWRVDQTDKVWGSRPQAVAGEPTTYGGYYTQEQLKDIVAYAKIRNITIVPEIEMPGHVASAIAAYPELSCKQTPQLQMTGGNYTNISSNFCAGNEDVFVFLENVLTEVMNIFPSTYIHVGGDEVDKEPWKQCPRCQERMKKEGLKNEEELQSYFIKRIEHFITRKKRKMIGWDEILEGGLAPEATVMSWRGESGGIQAAKMGHNVIMTPGSPCYFDAYQAGPEGEPLAIGGFNTLKRVYDYEPIPKELDSAEYKYILGAQGNVWTEYITTAEHLEYMVLPRMLALAEVVWSPQSTRNWADFSSRLKTHFKNFDQQGLHYSPGNFTVKIKPVSQAGVLTANLSTELNDLKIYYTTDGSTPDIGSQEYTQPINITSSQTIKAVTAKDGKVMTPTPAVQSFTIDQAIGSDVKYATPPSKYYPADGPNSLTDGIRGNTSPGKSWIGISKDNLTATIDLGTEKNLTRIAIGCLQSYKDWIFLPTTVRFEISSDGQNFREAGFVTNTIPSTTLAPFIHDFEVKFPSTPVRYLRVTAETIPACPKGHPGEGKPGWTFADEIIAD